MSRVAVVIPVYNGERFIRRALDSVLAQTLPADEVFVCDDGSSDATREILAEEYAGRVTLLEQQRGGPSRARNAGWRAATAELIAFLDADDWWEPGKLAAQVQAMDSDAVAVANVTAVRAVRETDGTVEFWGAPGPVQMRQSLRTHNPGMVPSCLMVRRTALEVCGGFNERQMGCEDWALCVELQRMGRITTVAEALTDYRVSAGGLSGNADHMYADFEKMLDDTLLRGERGMARWAWRQRAISFQSLRAAMTARQAGDGPTERRYMWRALWAWPSPFFARERFRIAAVTFLRRRGSAAGSKA